MKWYGAQVRIKIRGLAGSRVESGAAMLVDAIKMKLSRANPTGKDPSAPGEYPKYVTRELIDDIGYVFDPEKMTASIGTDVLHGKYLETGTRNMAPRPWLSNAIRDFRQELLIVLQKGGRITRPEAPDVPSSSGGSQGGGNQGGDGGGE